MPNDVHDAELAFGLFFLMAVGGSIIGGVVCAVMNL